RGGSSALLHPRARPDDDERRGPDVHELARQKGIVPDPAQVLDEDPDKMSLIAATRYVLHVRTNVVLIAASACGYYFLAGVQTFGLEFSKEQYRIDQPLASTLLLVVVGGALAGVVFCGSVGAWLLKRGWLNARVITLTV